MVYQGLIEELFSLDPDSIQGAWISPVPITDSTAFTVVTGNYGGHTYGARDRAMGFDPKVTTVSTYPVRTADDNHRVYIVDQNGAIVAQLPWGYSTVKISFCADFGGTDAILVIDMNDSGNPEADAAEGLVTTVPLISVPITSNAYASYVYSGQREYDMTIKAIQRDQQAVQGIASAGTSALGGGMMGAIAGGPTGAVAGVAVGLTTALVGTGVNYVTQGEFDRRTQNAVDKLTSNQAANIINSPGGQAWTTSIMPGAWKVVTLTRDSVSAAELSDEQSEFGYATDCYKTDCSSLIASGGGLRIEGLEVTGVGPEPARYLSAMFARGVHIDISSP